MSQAIEKDKRVKLFLRNFPPLSGPSSGPSSGPLNGLDCLLREILDSTTWLNADLQEQNVTSSEDAFGLRNLCDPRFPGAPSAFVIVLNSDSLTTACQWLAELQDRQPEVPVIAVTEEMEPDQIQLLLDCGVSDFIIAPFKPIDVIARIRRCLEFTDQRQSPFHTLKETLGLERLIGKSPVFRKEIDKIPQLARCDASVLIAGETGTGKELCASAIHYLSARAGHPFVPVNCGAIPVELMENELFGHARGAYTGANASQTGMISEANGGTLFLDEIDCLPLVAQVKLLRFLQNKEYRPLGSNRGYQADARVIAASNADFPEAIKSGRLRRDLYYRLNVLSLHLPPLREHRDDIPLLARHFLVKYANEFGKQAKDFSPGALRKLVGYDWSGNVRELENLIERAVALNETRIINANDIDLPVEISSTTITQPMPFQEAKARCVEQFEREYLQEQLRRHHGNITKAAYNAGKDRRAFWQLIRKHKIDARNFKPGRAAE